MSARSWTVTIPAPAVWLNANSRADRRREARTRRAWRDAAHIYARQAKLPKLGRASIIAELRFTDKRRRDAHNYYPTVKACIDGMVDYGLLDDDSDEFLVSVDIRRGVPLSAVKLGGWPYGQLTLTVREAKP